MVVTIFCQVSAGLAAFLPMICAWVVPQSVQTALICGMFGIGTPLVPTSPKAATSALALAAS